MTVLTPEIILKRSLEFHNKYVLIICAFRKRTEDKHCQNY